MEATNNVIMEAKLGINQEATKEAIFNAIPEEK